jgi:hypothetical protein
MSYAMLGPFDAADAKLLLKKVKLGDPITKKQLPSIVMEVAPLYALPALERSESHHFGGRLLTILYADMDVVSCEAVSPFESYYVGVESPLSLFRDGMQKIYDELGGSSLDARFRLGIGGGEMASVVEKFYTESDSSPCAIYHAQLSLGRIGIGYTKYDDEFLEAENKAMREAVERLRASGKLASWKKSV